MSIIELETILPSGRMPYQIPLPRSKLPHLRANLHILAGDEFELALVEQVVKLLGGWQPGIASPVAGRPACVHLACQIVQANQGQGEVPARLLDQLSRVEQILAELTRHTFPQLCQPPQSPVSQDNWLLDFYLRTAFSPFDHYLGVPCYYFLADQTHKLAAHSEVSFEHFYQIKVTPLLKLAISDFNWQSCPPFEKVACDEGKQAKLFNQLTQHFEELLAVSETPLLHQTAQEKLTRQVISLLKALFSFSRSLQEPVAVLTPVIHQAEVLTTTITPDTAHADLKQEEPAGEAALPAQALSEAEAPVLLPGALLICLEQIVPSLNQVRQNFEEAGLQELAEDVAERGILEPLLVRPHPQDKGKYQLIAGERRYRAARLARLSQVPVILKELDENEARLTGLIENIQRQELEPGEEQQAFQRLQLEYNWSVSEIARKVHKSRHYVLNRLKGKLQSLNSEMSELEINTASDPTTITTTITLTPEIEPDDKLASAEDESEGFHDLSPRDTPQNHTFSNQRLLTPAKVRQFERKVNHLLKAFETSGLDLEGEEAKQTWLATLETLSLALIRLKAHLDN